MVLGTKAKPRFRGVLLERASLAKCIEIVHTMYTLISMTTLNVRIDKKIKTDASKVFAGMGMDLSTGVKIFLTQVATEKGLPFMPTTHKSRLTRAQMDKEVAYAIKHGKRYKAGEDVLADI